MAAAPQRTPRLPPEIRRRELLDAAFDVIVEGGFEAFSIETVVRRAGVTRPVVYDLFGGLDGLLTALLDREEEATLRPLQTILGDGDPGPDVDPDAFLGEAVTGFLMGVRDNPTTWRFALVPPQGASPEIHARFERIRRTLAQRIAALLQWGVRKRGGPEGIDVELFSRICVAVGEDAARLMLLHPRRFTPERLGSLAQTGLALIPASAKRRGNPPPASYALTPLAAAAPATTSSPGRMPRSERREQLLDVTLELIADEGWQEVNVEAIARRAGVNRAIVYRSFANLHLLLVTLLRREDRRTKAMIDALLPADPGERTAPELIAELLARYLDAVLRHPMTYRVVLQRPESAPLLLQKLVNHRRATFALKLRPVVQWGLAGIAVPTEGIDVDLLARMLLSSGEELARLVLDDPEFPADRVLASAWALLDLIPVG